MLILFSSLLLVTHNHGYKVGDLATDVSLSNIDGKMVSLTDYDDAKGFIVIFTCNTLLNIYKVLNSTPFG